MRNVDQSGSQGARGPGWEGKRLSLGQNLSTDGSVKVES